MTTNDDFHDEPREDSPVEPAPDLRPSATVPRVWTVFVAFVVVVVAHLAVQIGLVIILVVGQVANGAKIERVAEDLPEMLTEPLTFIGLLLSSQFVIGVASIFPALLSREPTLSRLGLTTPSVPLWGYPIIMLGSGIPLAVGLALYYSLAEVMSPDQTFELFYKKITWPLAGPWVLFVGLAPGFMEEMFFRGYLQRRLLQRWSPWIAILVSSTLFAILHLLPHTIVFAFPFGIWLGVIAWRTGSVWPCIICHALVNGSGAIHEIGIRLAGWPEVPPIAVTIPIGILATGSFGASIWLLARSQPIPPVTADVLPIEGSNSDSGEERPKMSE